MSRQDPIDEGGEGDASPGRRDSRSSLEKTPTERDRLLDPTKDKEREKERFERNLALERERQIEMASSRSTTAERYDTGLREEPATLAQRDLIATVLDMKVDVRLEMQRLNQRVGRMEEVLQEILQRLPHDSSGQSTPCTDPPSVIAVLSPKPPPVPVSAAAAASCSLTVPSSSSGGGLALPETSSGGNGLGPILLRKRRSKSRRAPAPPRQSSEQARLLESEPQQADDKPSKKEFL